MLWKLRAKDEYVLPHPNSDKPSELKHPLEKFRKKIDIPELTFQNLRKNFVSYAVSFGTTPAICAFWVGHSPAIAEKNYLRYAIGRLKGNNIEESMGLSEILQDAIKGYTGSGKDENLKLTKWA